MNCVLFLKKIKYFISSLIDQNQLNVQNFFYMVSIKVIVEPYDITLIFICATSLRTWYMWSHHGLVNQLSNLLPWACHHSRLFVYSQKDNIANKLVEDFLNKTRLLQKKLRFLLLVNVIHLSKEIAHLVSYPFYKQA